MTPDAPPSRRLRISWRPSPVGLTAGLLVAMGLVLGAAVDMVWLVLTAVGALGPGLLREIGWLRKSDEFQRQATRRAGYHAYLAGAVFLFTVTILQAAGGRNLDQVPVEAGVVLTCMLVTYFVSYLTRYWGVRRAAVRILCAFGLFWLVFVVLSHSGEPMALLMEGLVPGVFFALAFVSRRWPRGAGAFLLGAGVFAFVAFDLHEGFARGGGQLYVVFLLLLPLLYTGIGLLRCREADGEGWGDVQHRGEDRGEEQVQS